MTTYPDIAGWCADAGGIITPGTALKFMRESFGLEVEDVAACAGVNATVLLAVEHGERDMPAAWLGAVMEVIVHLRGECFAAYPITAKHSAFCTLLSGHSGAHEAHSENRLLFTWWGDIPAPTS